MPRHRLHRGRLLGGRRDTVPERIAPCRFAVCPLPGLAGGVATTCLTFRLGRPVHQRVGVAVAGASAT